MFDKIIAFSVRNKLIVLLLVLGLVGWGGYSASQLSIDAVPDITNNQVQIVTTSPSLAAQEVEKFITYPIELKMANLPNTTEIRSISRYGLSIVTIIFDPDYPLLNARQLVSEYIQTLGNEIPPSLGTPELMPITTGLGEVYQYTLQVDDAYVDNYSSMELRTIQDWVVKRQLSGIEGVVEISSFGGFLKQYEVEVDPGRLHSVGLTVTDLFNAIEKNNQNTGGSYIEKGPRAYYVRTEGLIKSKAEIESIPLRHDNGIPLRVGDIASVKEGFAPRFGAMTKDGNGEAVGGILLMLKGENAFQVVKNIEDRVAETQATLPEGVHIEPYLNRADLVTRVIKTVRNNLVEGGLIVIFVLVLLLGNFRAGLVVASVIPLSLLFAFSLMNAFGISANLMSLGAVDFGIVVDGSVIIVEAIIHRFQHRFKGQRLTKKEFENNIIDAAQKIRNSAAFGEIIILIVYLPILVLAGIEGKTFKPMAQTVAFAILGAFILSMTYVPMMSSLLLSRKVSDKASFADRMIAWLQQRYEPILANVLKFRKSVIVGAVLIFAGVIWLFSSLGAVFIPTLGEGDLAMQLTIPPGGNLNQSIETCTKAEQILIDQFPEVKHVVSKIGTAEVPTDPMAMENSDIMIILKPQDEWTSASNREELVAKMKESLHVVLGATFEFTQPIQLRFNELLTGSKSDLAVKIYGEDLSILSRLGDKAERLIQQIPGAADVKAEQLEGLPQLMIRYQREKLAEYNLDIKTVNDAVQTAFAGTKASTIYEGEKRFDFVVRLKEDARKNDQIFNQLYVKNNDGISIPVSQVAKIDYEEGPMQISRENTKRRITVGVNIRERDVKSLVDEIDQTLKSQLNLPPGYSITYGGDFENLESATNRLLIAVPIALALIFILLFFAFRSVIQAAMIFTAIPLASIGGVLALWLRDMPFSISAGIGFIALFGVAVLNGIVMIAEFNFIKEENPNLPLHLRILQGAKNRLRPVLMTASVAAFGFLPMALSTSDGAEVQQPLATVVIGGLITATLLTLFVLPAIYELVEKNAKPVLSSIGGVAVFLLLIPQTQYAQEQPISLDSALKVLQENNVRIARAELDVQQSAAQESGSWQLGATSLNWQRGQMNTAAVDNYWSIQQNFGNPFADAASVGAQKANTKAAEANQLLTQKQMTAALKQTYVNARLSQEQAEKVEILSDRFQQLVSIAKQRLESGEIAKVDALLIERQAGELELMMLNAKQQYYHQLVLLNRLLNQENSFYQPEEVDINELLASIPLSVAVEQSAHLAVENQKKRVLEKQMKAEKMALAPSFSAGYFNQELDRVPGFQGFSIGVNVPLWFLPQKSKMKAAQLQVEQQKLSTYYKKIEVQGNINILLRRLETLDKQKRYFEKTALPQAKALQEQAEIMVKTGEASAVQIVQSIRQSNQIEIDYLEVLKQLSTTLFQLEQYQ